MHYVQKNNLFLAWLARIYANSNQNYRPYNFQALAMKFPENLQPLVKVRIWLWSELHTTSYNSHQRKAAGKVFRIGAVRYNWPMSAHASQAFSIAHCTGSEDLSDAL